MLYVDYKRRRRRRRKSCKKSQWKETAKSNENSKIVDEESEQKTKYRNERKNKIYEIPIRKKKERKTKEEKKKGKR